MPDGHRSSDGALTVRALPGDSPSAPSMKGAARPRSETARRADPRADLAVRVSDVNVCAQT